MANTEAGRHLIGEKSSQPIVHIAPSSHTIYLGQEKGKPVYKTTAYTKPRNSFLFGDILSKYIILNESKYKPKEEDTYKAFLHYAGIEKYNFPTINLLSGTYYTVAAGDGGVYRSGDASYATAHDSASGTAKEDTNATSFLANDNSGFLLSRIFLPFDTTAITQTIVVSALTLSVYYSGTRDTTYDDTAQIVQSTQASPTALALSDYSLLGSTGGGTSAAWSTWSAGAYTAITGNATSLGWFTGGSSYFQLGLRASRDIANTTPAQRSYIYMYMSEQTGTGNDPKLDLTYTIFVPSTGGGSFLLNFV